CSRVCVRSCSLPYATPSSVSFTPSLHDALPICRLKAGNDRVEKDDILAGLTAIVTVRLAEPKFEGQTKEVLGTPAARQIVSKVVADQLTDILQSRNRAVKQQVDGLLEKIVAEMKSRIMARTAKETQRRKTALETSSMPAKLADCRSTSVENTELF